jgi:ABC-type uncharacterized transport system involved in gliding motility auxiliary subunit
MRKQAVRYTLTGVVGIALAVALTLMVNWLASRHYVSSDWTSSKMYSISDKTLNILDSIEEEIRVIVFMTPESSLYDQVSQLLNRYAAASSNIDVQYIDPDKEPLKTRQLAEQFGISVADTVVFAFGDRTKYVTSDQMAEFDYAGMQYGQAPTMRAFKGEEQFTSAILSLVAPEVPKIYFVTGHGEAAIAGGGGTSDRSLAVLAETLKRENIEAEDTALLSGTFPEDADVLAIIGPTKPFTETEIEVLGRYLDGGGRLLVALDPLIESAGGMRSTRLEEFLADWGVEVNDDLVVDPSKRLPFYDLSAVYLTDFGTHPVTQGLEGVAVLFTVTRSLQPNTEAGAEVIVSTSDEGWGETNLQQLLTGQPVGLDEADNQPPAVVGVVVDSDTANDAGETPDDDVDDSRSTGHRLIVFGDSDFMADYEISNAGNLTLAMNTFNWLAARDQSLGIAAREVEQVNLFLSQDQMRNILLLVLLVMPGAAIILGILVWRRRRH